MKLIIPFNISRYAFFQRDEKGIADLEGHFEPNNPAYLYCILSKNRITVNPGFTHFNTDYIELEFLIQDKENFIKERIKWMNPYEDLKEAKVVSEFPFNKLKLIDEYGSDLWGYSKATYILNRPDFYSQIINKNLLDYEILYIGESVYSKNNLPVLDRTVSHKTFQKILEEHQSIPDKELFLFFFSMKQAAIVDISENQSEKELEEFTENFTEMYFNSKLNNVKQNVKLFEAGLINYFKPKYNDKFKHTSPSKKNTSFKDLNKMNLREIKILFGIENFHPRLYTATSGRKDEYEISIEFK